MIKRLVTTMFMLAVLFSFASSSDTRARQVRAIESDQVSLSNPADQILEPSFPEAPQIADASFTSTIVQITDMSTLPFDPPSPDPSGLAYLPLSNSLIMVDGDVEETVEGITHFEGANIWEMTLGGSVIITANISTIAPTVVPMTDEPTGVAWNPGNGHYYFTDDDSDRIFDLDPGLDGQIGTGDDSWTDFTLNVSNTDAEGIAFDTSAGVIYVADDVGAEIYSYATDGTYLNSFDVDVYGIGRLESVEYNPDSDTLLILGSPPYSQIIETTTSGVFLRAIDFPAADIPYPAGLAYAPASDGSGIKHFYIVDWGIDNDVDPYIIDGKMFEMTAPDPITPGNQYPIVDAGSDQVITLPVNSVLLDGTATDDGLPDPPGIITTTWSQENGPCQVVFTDTNAISTTAYFQYPGSYFIHLTADDGELTPFDETIIHVERDPDVNAFDLLVADSSDDAEEFGTGTVTVFSEDLELVYDGTDPQVGLRYVGVDIPAGASITNAYIQFTVDEVGSEETSLIIQGEDTDQALAFEPTPGNVSSRTKTTAAVSWNPNPWSTVGESGTDQRTPNIAGVIQEIIDRPGWTSGNSLAFIITGTGRRTAEAYDGDYCGAPLLHIEFTEAENTPPIAVDDGYTTDEDVTLNVVAPGVLVNDTDVDGDNLTAILNTDVTSGTLTLNPDGSFEYVPNLDFNGMDSFSYVANDGSVDSTVATVTITVDPVNDGGPVAVDDGYTTDEDVTLNVVAPGVLVNDTDVDGDHLIAILDTGPISGTLTLNFDGSFQYTPNADFNGTDTFSYVAIGGFVVSNVATVTITVDSVNDAPVAVDDSYTTNKNTSLNVAVPCVLENDTDTDGDTLTASLETAPGNGSLTLNLDGSFEYIPDAGFTGTDTFTYAANDGTDDSNVATVTINVNNVIFLPLVLK